MKKTCTVTHYLCTRKMIVELKFDYYERVSKMGMDSYFMRPVSRFLDFSYHWC